MEHETPGLYFTMVQIFLDQVKIYLTTNAAPENWDLSALVIKQKNPFRHVVRHAVVTREIRDTTMNLRCQTMESISVDAADICCLFCLAFTFPSFGTFSFGDPPLPLS